MKLHTLAAVAALALAAGTASAGPIMYPDPWSQPPAYDYGIFLSEATPTGSVSFTNLGAGAWEKWIGIVLDNPGDIAGNLSSTAIRLTGAVTGWNVLFNGIPLVADVENLPGGRVDTSFLLAFDNLSSGVFPLYVSGVNFNATGSSGSADFAWTESVATVPEPSTFALAGLALFGIGAASRRRVNAA